MRKIVRERYALFLSLLVIALLAMKTMLFPKPYLEELDGKRVTVSGKITKLEKKEFEEGKTQENSFYVYIKCKEPVGTILYYAKDEEEFEDLLCGYYVKAKGTFALFPEATNPGEFDRRKYYRSIGVEGKLQKSELTVERKPKSLEVALSKGKRAVSKEIEKLYGRRTEGILKTMLVGDGGSLQGETKELFEYAGISHVLSISSLHVSVIGYGLMRLFKKLRLDKSVSYGIASVAMVCVGVLIDGGVSAWRAIASFLYRFVTFVLKRSHDTTTGLVYAATVTLILNPERIYNSGFLLSYGCVLSFVLLSEAFGLSEFRAKAENIKAYLSTSVRSSICVLTGALPIMLSAFYEVSLWGIGMNIWVIPLMSVVLSLALISIGLGIISWIVPIFEMPCRVLTWGVSFLISCIESACRLIQKANIRPLVFGKPKIWQIIGYLIGISLFIREGKKEKKKKSQKKLCLFWSLAILFLILPTHRKNCVTFLNIGQGDAIVVETTSGKTFLVDGGSSSLYDGGESVIENYLKYNGIGRIEGVFLSHPDLDHMKGIEGIVKKKGLFIKQVYIAKGSEAAWKEKQENFVKALNDNHIQVSTIYKGERTKAGSASFLCLGPSGKRNEGENADSLILLLTMCDQHTFLLTGDVEGRGERELIQTLQNNPSLKAQVLKIPHHGSGNSTREELLALLCPKEAIVSVGRNTYGHPSPKVITRLKKYGILYHRTDKDGAIIFRCDHNNMKKVLF